MISVDPHPLLHLATLTVEFDVPLGESRSPQWLLALLDDSVEAPLSRSEALRTAIRDLLRHGGYKPTGRGKPASEYLVRAAGEGKLGAINVVVDVLNVVSLHSGVPISVVDLDRVVPPLNVSVAADDSEFVFNESGQTIRVGGLLCLHDSNGACANAVKDSQRTKTHDGTHRALVVFWGHRDFSDIVNAAREWYRVLLDRVGIRCTDE